MLDPFAQFGMVVEEGMGDACFALHGLEVDWFTAFNESADGLVGVSDFVLGLGFRCLVEGGDSEVSGVGHKVLLRWRVRSRVCGTGPALG